MLGLWPAVLTECAGRATWISSPATSSSARGWGRSSVRVRSPSNRGEPAHTDAFADRSGCRRTRVIVELDDRTVAIRRGL